MENILKYTEYKSGNNWTTAVAKALDNGCNHIFFPKGIYHFFPAGTTTKYCYFTNNDEGLKNLVFNVENQSKFTISGEGAEFIFHERIIPFRFFQVNNLNISGISIDFDQHPVIWGKVVAYDSNDITIELPPERKYWIIDGKICFINDSCKFLREHISYEFYDTKRGEMAAGRASGSMGIEAREIAPQIVSMKLLSGNPKVGDTIVFKPEARLTPGIVLDECHNVTLKHLAIYCACGMGIVAQNSFDISLEKVIVDIPHNSQRLISVADDGIHFANCGGKISINDCSIKHQWDDAVNIHGVYRSYLNRSGVHCLRADHFQQQGIPFAKVGEHLLIDKKVYTIATIKHVTKQLAFFTTLEPIPEDLPKFIPVLNQDRQPDVEIINCCFSSNKPRGVLVSSGGHVVIKNNYFHTPGGAIFISGDAEFWFESGPVYDVLICENTFDNCFYQAHCFSTRAVIDIKPYIDNLKPDEYYHHNIRIIDNLFKDNHGIMIRAKDTDNLIFAQNIWECDSTYNAQKSAPHWEFEHCRNITLENNNI